MKYLINAKHVELIYDSAEYSRLKRGEKDSIYFQITFTLLI